MIRTTQHIWPKRNAVPIAQEDPTMLTAHTLNDRICAHFHNAAHAMEVPANARLLFCNGQVGARLDGTVPETPLEQIEVIFDRIRTILTAANMTFTDVVKLTIYVTDKAILDDYFRVRGPIMGDHNPPAVILVVGPFPRPGVEVEIEAIAAKAG
jgi:enamine deaminase RidA (YjgF/YER057c/UK114 family)